MDRVTKAALAAQRGARRFVMHGHRPPQPERAAGHVSVAVHGTSPPHHLNPDPSGTLNSGHSPPRVLSRSVRSPHLSPELPLNPRHTNSPPDPGRFLKQGRNPAPPLNPPPPHISIPHQDDHLSNGNVLTNPGFHAEILNPVNLDVKPAPQNLKPILKPSRKLHSVKHHLQWAALNQQNCRCGQAASRGADMRGYLQEYSTACSLPGVHYVGEPARHPVERIMWIIVLLIFAVLGISEVAKVFSRWRSSPVMVSFAHRPTNVATIPFPSVTLCPETRVRRSLVDVGANSDTIKAQLEGKRPFTSALQQLQVEAAVLQCHERKSVIGLPEFKFSANFTPTQRHIDYLMSTLAVQMDDIMVSCTYNGETRPCKDYFRTTMTGYGPCFTFNTFEDRDLFSTKMQVAESNNILASRKSMWHPEEGYRNYSEKDVYPYHPVQFVGRGQGLQVVLKVPAETDVQDECSLHADEADIRVVLGPPHEAPDMIYGNAVHVEPGGRVELSLQTRVTLTEEDLRKFTPAQRRCYFQGERNLTVFAKYTQGNCEVDCYYEIYREACQCSIFTVPLEKNSRIPFCSTQQINMGCGSNFEAMLGRMLVNAQALIADGQNVAICNCLPECSELVFPFHLSTAMYNPPKSMRPARVILWCSGSGSRTPPKFSLLSVFYEESLIVARRRNELYSITDFIASAGGILGTFSGFSLVTLAEVFYFATLRLACRLRDRRRLQDLRDGEA